MFHGYSLDLGQMAQVPRGPTPLPLILARLVKQTSRWPKSTAGRSCWHLLWQQTLPMCHQQMSESGASLLSMCLCWPQPTGPLGTSDLCLQSVVSSLVVHLASDLVIAGRGCIAQPGILHTDSSLSPTPTHSYSLCRHLYLVHTLRHHFSLSTLLVIPMSL